MTLTHDIDRVEAAGSSTGRPPPAPAPRVARRRRWPWALALVAAVAASAWRTGIGSGEVVNPGGWDSLTAFFRAAASPELDPDFLRLTWDSALVTVAYAVLGSALSVVIGLVLGLVTSDAWRLAGDDGPVLRRAQQVVRAALVPARAVHEAVYAIVLVNILGLDPLVAVLAIGLPFGAVTAKVFAHTLDDVGRHQVELLRASGATRGQIVAYALLPAAAANLTTYGFYRFECSLRAAAVLGVIGAGGLGFQIRLSFQSLEYGEMWTLLYALILLCGLADAWSSAVRGRGRATGAARQPQRRVVVASLVGGALAVAWSWWQLGIDVSTLWAPRAIESAARFLRESWPPEAPEGLAELVSVSIDTLAMSVLSITVAFAVAVVAAQVAARPRAGHGSAAARLAAAAARLVLLVWRAVPPPVWALLALFVLFPGPLPGALALAIYNAGVLGRLLAELVENLDHRGEDVLRASGASRVQAFCYDRLPRLAPGFASLGLYRWEVTIRETVVVGLVAAGGLGYVLDAELAAFDYPAVAGTLLALVAVTALVDLLSTRLRRGLR